MAIITYILQTPSPKSLNIPKLFIPQPYWLCVIRIKINPVINLLQTSTMPQSNISISSANPSNIPLLSHPTRIWKFNFIIMVIMIQKLIPWFQPLGIILSALNLMVFRPPYRVNPSHPISMSFKEEISPRLLSHRLCWMIKNFRYYLSMTVIYL